MNPLQRYRLDIDKNRIIPDPFQLSVVERAQSLYGELVNAAAKKKSFAKRFLARVSGERIQPVRGLYLWGSVGSGKTYIVDAFYDCLPFDNKLRVHFHRYMQWVHAELKQLKDVEEPLRRVADKLAEDVSIICFDEFHVSDITDAMLLSGLFHALFNRGVTLVATSNEPPEKLYWDGLQRERFLPAIELIKQHTHIVNLDTGVDYRLRYLDQAEIYHYPLGADGREKLAESFENIAPEISRTDSSIEIEGREINVKRLASGVVWFDFHQLCDGPRGAADYIEIARQFQTVFIENVPKMDDADNDRVKRFITMVDEYYDRNVKLIVTAEARPEELYAGNRLAKAFERTVSRLVEMQSRDYLGKAHLPS